MPASSQAGHEARFDVQRQVWHGGALGAQSA
jgi:hypothetical protein